MSGGDMVPPVSIKSICRECGALCSPDEWEAQQGVCPRCAFGRRPPQVAVHPVESVRRLYVNGVEIVGESAIYEALKARDSLPIYDPRTGITTTAGAIADDLHKP